MTTSWVKFPMVECPYCEKEFQVDDYYDIETGSTFHCLHCEKEIEVYEIDTVIEARIGCLK